MRVLLVAWGLPPCRGSGVYRALALARQLVELGVSVTALTATRETFLALYGADTALEAHLPDGVRLVRVPFFPERLWPVINDWPAARVNERAAWSRSARENDYRLFPEDVYASWLRPATAEAFAVASDREFDLIIATGNPYVDFEVAHAVHNTFSIPFVLDDRDSFLYDVFTGEPGRLFDQRLPLYRQYVDKAVEYWCVNPPITELHRRAARADAQSKVQVVENGWDAQFPPFGHRTPRAATARMGFVGTVTSGFPVDAVLSAWRSARSSSSLDVELHFFGDVGFSRGAAASDVAATLVSAADDGVVVNGRITKASIADAYGMLDALLFAKEGGALITSGKSYEYAASGLPIAALGLAGQDAARVLARYPRLHEDLTNGAAAAIVAALRDARSDGASDRERAARSFGRRLERGNQLRPALQRVLEAAR